MFRIKEFRESQQLTQQKVADYLGITRAAYTNLENGKRNPDPDTLLRLADLFHITVDELLGRATEKEALSVQGLTLDEKQILTLYRQLSDGQKESAFRHLLHATMIAKHRRMMEEDSSEDQTDLA